MEISLRYFDFNFTSPLPPSPPSSCNNFARTRNIISLLRNVSKRLSSSTEFRETKFSFFSFKIFKITFALYKFSDLSRLVARGGGWGNCDNFLIRMLYKVERWREDITRNSNIDEEQYPGGSAEGKGEHSPSSITGMNNIEDVVTTYYIYYVSLLFQRIKAFRNFMAKSRPSDGN